jgi:hypothetical protein
MNGVLQQIYKVIAVIDSRNLSKILKTLLIFRSMHMKRLFKNLLHCMKLNFGAAIVQVVYQSLDFIIRLITTLLEALAEKMY